MLSYDSPVSVNGQSAKSPTNMAAALPSMIAPSSPRTARLPQPVMPMSNNGVIMSSVPVTPAARPASEPHIWLVTGPAGSGKTTIARHLANSLHLPYIEGDEFHPPANIEKMSNGIPLTDADRWDWLTALREESIRQLRAGNNGVVLTCSALKRKYRDVIRVAPYFAPKVHLHFIYLSATEEVLLARVLARQNHYMGANMVHSQFNILEPPTVDETDVITVDVSGPPEGVKADVVNKVLLKLDELTNPSS